jgi:hypothetical protein
MPTGGVEADRYGDAVSWTFCTTGRHSRFLFCEFPLGSRYKVDVVALLVLGCVGSSFRRARTGGRPSLHEGRGAVCATEHGCSPDRRLASLHQRESTQVQASLVRWAKQRDLLGHFPTEPLSNMSGDRLGDPSTVLLERYHVVIGRTSRMDAETRSRFGDFGDGVSRPALVSSSDRGGQPAGVGSEALGRPHHSSPAAWLVTS